MSGIGCQALDTIEVYGGGTVAAMDKRLTAFRQSVLLLPAGSRSTIGIAREVVSVHRFDVPGAHRRCYPYAPSDEPVMAAQLIVVDVTLSTEQEETLRRIAASLPDGWNLRVRPILTREGSGFSVALDGPGFVTSSGFPHGAHVNELAKFVETTRGQWRR